MNEKLFTTKIVIPLLHRLKFFKIRYTHGSNEFGRDLVFFDKDRFGQTLTCAAQVKCGDIRGKQKDLIQNKIIPQLREAIGSSYCDPDSGETFRINLMYLIISGILVGTAKNQFYSFLKNEPNIFVIDRQSLSLFASREGIETNFGFRMGDELNPVMFSCGQRKLRFPFFTKGTMLEISLQVDDIYFDFVEIVDVFYDPLWNEQNVILLIPKSKKHVILTSKLMDKLQKCLYGKFEEFSEIYPSMLLEDTIDQGTNNFA